MLKMFNKCKIINLQEQQLYKIIVPWKIFNKMDSLIIKRNLILNVYNLIILIALQTFLIIYVNHWIFYFCSIFLLFFIVNQICWAWHYISWSLMINNSRYKYNKLSTKEQTEYFKVLNNFVDELQIQIELENRKNEK